MASSYPRGRTPEEIQREAERTRADIAETLDELQRRLSPAHYKALVTDRASPLWDVIRRHPAPVLVIGFGLLWLATELAREGERRRRGGPVAPLPPDRALARAEDLGAAPPLAVERAAASARPGDVAVAPAPERAADETRAAEVAAASRRNDPVT